MSTDHFNCLGWSKGPEASWWLFPSSPLSPSESNMSFLNADPALIKTTALKQTFRWVNGVPSPIHWKKRGSTEKPIQATQPSKGWAWTLALLPVFSKEESSSAQCPWFSLHAHPRGQWLSSIPMFAISRCTTRVICGFSSTTVTITRAVCLQSQELAWTRVQLWLCLLPARWPTMSQGQLSTGGPSLTR